MRFHAPTIWVCKYSDNPPIPMSGWSNDCPDPARGCDGGIDVVDVKAQSNIAGRPASCFAVDRRRVHLDHRRTDLRRLMRRSAAVPLRPEDESEDV